MQPSSPPSPFRHLGQAPHDQSADFVELFFDLVFVFAITEVTHSVSHHLDFRGVLGPIVVFWMIWWAWTQLTWTLNSADTSTQEIRLGTLATTAVAFAMATSVGRAFTAESMWFALPYVLVKLLGLGLFLRVSWVDVEERKAVIRYALASQLGLWAVLAGAMVDPGEHLRWWGTAIALDLLAAVIGIRAKGWNIRVAHFVERHALIVIIALGESLIVAGSAVAKDEWTPALLVLGGLSVLVTCLLWWTYFGWTRESMEEQLLLRSSEELALVLQHTYSFGHFPVVCGVIAFAAGLLQILREPSAPIAVAAVWALAAGMALFVGSTALGVLRVCRLFLWPRMIILCVGTGALFLTIGALPWVSLAVEAGTLAAVVIAEAIIRPREYMSRS